MTESLLIAEIGKTLSKQRVEELVEMLVKHKFAVPKLIDLTFHEKVQVAFRAAWLLEGVFLVAPAFFHPHLDNFLERFPTQSNSSAQRHFSKILLQLTGDKSPYRNIVQHPFAESIIEAVFSWLINEQSPVAVKAHCISILANFSTAHQWVKDELLQTINFMEDQERFAFHARAKKIKQRLK